MSIERKRTETVYGIVRELVEGGKSVFRPGDVCSVLRERNRPMGAWLVRGEFSVLEQESLIEPIPETGDWRLTGNEMLATDSRRHSNVDREPGAPGRGRERNNAGMWESVRMRGFPFGALSSLKSLAYSKIMRQCAKRGAPYANSLPGAAERFVPCKVERIPRMATKPGFPT